MAHTITYQSARGRRKTPGIEQKILQVAQLFFARRGFDDVGMNDIAREAGLSKTTLYAYFRGKQDLFKAALDELLARLPPPAELAAGSEHQQVPEQLLYIARRLDALLSSMTFDLIRRTLTSDIPAPQRERIWRAAGLPYLDAIVDYFRTQQRLGTLHVGDPRSAASFFVALIAGGKALHSQLSGSSFGFIEEDRVREAVGLFLKAHATQPGEAHRA